MVDDIYTLWLDIPISKCPPDSYTLLGVPKGVTNAQFIEDATQRRLKQIHKYVIDPNPATREECARLISEIAQARRALLLPDKKQDTPARVIQRSSFDEPIVQDSEPAHSRWMTIVALLLVGIIIGAAAGFALQRTRAQSSIVSLQSALQKQSELSQQFAQAKSQIPALQNQVQSLQKLGKLSMEFYLAPLLGTKEHKIIPEQQRYFLPAKLLNQAAIFLRAQELSAIKKSPTDQSKSPDVVDYVKANRPKISVSFFIKSPAATRAAPFAIYQLGLAISRTKKFSLLPPLLPDVATAQLEPYLLAGIAEGLLDKKAADKATAMR